MQYIVTNEKRNWKYEEEESYDSLCFYLKNKPLQKIILVKDKYVKNMFDIHFLYDYLADSEKQILFKSICDYLKEGEYLGSCGYSSFRDSEDFKKFSYHTTKFKNTGCLRIIKSNDGGNGYPFPILQRI